MLKDYYKILEISPNASTVDIKKSYRRLALQYHPDKNFGNNLYEAKFKEITEAYQILSNLKQRQEYNIRVNIYKQRERKKAATPPVTPALLLHQAVEFRKKIAVLDSERMNKRALYQHIQHLLSQHNISILKYYNDQRINRRIMEEILFCSRFLPFAHVEKICFQLTAIAGTDNSMYRTIFRFSKDSKRREFWNKYKLMVGLLIAFIFCLFIYFIS